MKMRDKIKFQKLEEISLEEIQGGENGQLNKVKCVLLMVIRKPSDYDRVSKVGDGEDVISTVFGNLVGSRR